MPFPARLSFAENGDSPQAKSGSTPMAVLPCSGVSGHEKDPGGKRPQGLPDFSQNCVNPAC
jgi:hypothetical protein